MLRGLGGVRPGVLVGRRAAEHQIRTAVGPQRDGKFVRGVGVAGLEPDRART